MLAEGAYRELMLTNRQYAFARIKDQDAIIIAVNNDENPAELYVPVPLQADEFVNLESKEVLRWKTDGFGYSFRLVEVRFWCRSEDKHVVLIYSIF